MMLNQSGQKDFLSITVDSTNYDNSKGRRRQSPWRYWNRLSSLQRSVVCLIIIIGTISAIYIFPLIYKKHPSSEDDEIERLSRGRQNEVDIFSPAPHLRPPPPQRQNVKKFAEQAVKDIHQKANKIMKEMNKQNPPVKRGPPQVRPRDNEEPVGHMGAPPDDSDLEDMVAADQDDVEPKIIPRVGPAVGDLSEAPQNTKQKAVVEAFRHAWSAYKKYAWGRDELQPLSKTYGTWFGVGLTLIDSLDTMYIMGLTEEFNEAKDWVTNEMSLDVDKDVNLFECTIRVLGGLLSAYHLSGEQVFLDKAVEAGDRLLPAFRSGSKVPYSDVNLKTGKAHAPRWGPDSSTSEVTTIQLEFRDLSYITGDPKYRDAVDGVTHHVHTLPKKEGLVPIFINANTGNFRSSSTITLGARGDSYYEYLLKMWLQGGKKEQDIKDDYVAAVNGMKHLLLKESEPDKLPFFGELLGGHSFSPKMDHLVCFMGGTLALGAHNGLSPDHLDLGRQITRTCWETYRRMPTGLAPEITHFNTNPSQKDDLLVKPADSHNLQRPETVESLFYLYRLTGDKQYRDWGWKIFTAFEKYTKLPEGYSSINNVKSPGNPGKRDKMESFFLGETLKYFYLLFSDNDNLMPLDKWVFNTEAHPLPIHS